MPWHVYLLRLHNGSVYIGCTDDLERRLMEHHGGTGAKVTSESRTIDLIHSESFLDRRSALKRERQLKRWSRAKKLALAEGRIDEVHRLAKSDEARHD
jgi:predicted GIY-YIG superfamily endonuclease